MAATYTLIDSYTVGSGGASSVTLGSGGTIPQTYTDLLVKISAREATGGGWCGFMYFNNSNSNLQLRSIYGSGSNAYSQLRTDGLIGMNDSGSGSNIFSNSDIYIPNYTSSNYKSFSQDSVTEDNATLAYILSGAMLWSSTSAINRIDFIAYTGNIAQYSTFYLYGIKNS